MRKIKKIHKAAYRPISDLKTWSPLPTSSLSQIDPFIFLNHHGAQVYPPNNNGLPFGPHPHRGMETVTFILDGDIMHKDSDGHNSVITAGGVQWMTAGSGLIHAEISSDDFKRVGGKLEILQLWLNLPARLKMTKPFYKGLQKEDIPALEYDEGKIKAQLISGNWDNTNGAFQSESDIHLSTLFFKTGAEITYNIPVERNIFCYIVKGRLLVNETAVEEHQLIEFENDAELVKITAFEDSTLIFGHAVPFKEPMVAYGPFVMNTEEEIQQAYQDYNDGKFGSWND